MKPPREKSRIRIDFVNHTDVYRKIAKMALDEPEVKKKVASVLKLASTGVMKDVATAMPSKVKKSKAYGGSNISALKATMKGGARQGRRKGFVATGYGYSSQVAYSNGKTSGRFDIQTINFGQKSNRMTKSGRNTGRIGSNKGIYKTDWGTEILRRKQPYMERVIVQGFNRIINEQIL